MRSYGVLALTAALVTCGVAGAAQNLVYNGDFEEKSAVNPPPGWVMWGAQVYKVPENFTRDTNRPHAGEACFRIHHPPNTEGYIVSAPEYAVRPKRGMMYEVSFWARTDQPGPSQFYFTAYETIKPYRDAPSPGRWVIDVTEDWQEFHFTIREGWDFFADRSQYILLTFNATRERTLEKTLWIDDVVMRELPSDREGRLVDESSLTYEPLQHRLREGERLEVTVEVTKPWRPATRTVGGVSFHRVCGWTGQPYNREGAYTLAPEIESAIREMRLPMTRFYAVGDEPFGVEAALDKVAELVNRLGIPQEMTVLEFETQGATSKLPPETWAQGVRHSKARGYGFRYWEISNEPYLVRPDTVFATPDEYIEHVKAVSAAIRAIDPQGQIGVAISRDLAWGNYVLKQTAGCYDFVVGHYYAVSDIHRRKFEVAVLTENYRTLDRILRVNALLKAYNAERDAYQLDTEWGMHSTGPQGERADYVDRNANILGTLHRAVRLIYYAREGMLRGASSWQMLSNLTGLGFGVLSQQAPEKRCMIYWLYYYFNRHIGDQVLAMDGTAPYYTPVEGDDPHTQPGEYPGPLTPALVTLSQDGRTVYFVAVNGSWEKTVPCRMILKGFAPQTAEGVVLSSDDPNGSPLLEQKEDFVKPLLVRVDGGEVQCDLPAHSAVFVTLRSYGG
ncbi:MAG: hypothetical protein ACUVX8_11340 [Candidatus Zipacnadales bacterium]